MGSVPQKKGLSFVAVRDYALQYGGRPGWDGTLSAMSPEDAEVIQGVVGVGWYPLDLYGRLVRAVDRQIGKGDLQTIPQMGRFEAERDVPTIHRVLLKMVKPAYIVEKMAELWPRYNTTGRLTIHRLGPQSVDVTLSDWSDDEAMCASVHGYSERALQLAGARNLRIVQTSCRAKGATVCVFRAAWGSAV